MCQTIEAQPLPRISVKDLRQSEVCETCNSMSHANTSYPTYSQVHHRYHTGTSERLHTPHTHRYTTDTIQVHQRDFIPHLLTLTPQIPYRYIRKTSYPTYSHLHHRYHISTSERLHAPSYTCTTDAIHQKHFIPHILTLTPQITRRYIGGGVNVR